MTSLISKLGLGSAQFVPGASIPARGRTPEVEARDILSIAGRAGLSVFDASGAWGRSETLLGDLMPRPLPFRLVIATVRPDKGPDFVEQEIRASLARLAVERVDAVVVPLAGDLFGPQGPAMWTRLQQLRDAGLIGKIGVSLHSTDDPCGVVRRFRPDLIQAPASLLDQRMLADGTLERIAGMGVEVQLRSIFLNGLLFLPLDRIPTPLKAASGSLSRVRRMIAEGRSDPLQAALGFALSRPEASTVLVNVTTAAELSAVIAAAAASPPPDLDWTEMAMDDPVVLDPRRWAAA